VFTIPDGAPGARKWFDKAGAANVRVARAGGDVAGGLVLLPMAQWFGGRAVPMAGVAGVAIAPEHRGGGAATTMMRETLRGLRTDGFPISTLYPATQTLYRRVGYERAGVDVRHSIAAKSIDVRERAGRIRRATDADRAGIEACCRTRAAGTNGNLERGEYVWQRIRDGWLGKAHAYVVEEGVVEEGVVERGPGAITGYVFYLHRQSPERIPDLACTDLCATTAVAARRLLGFFADHRSLAGKVSWTGPANDPLAFHLREQAEIDHEINYHWMLRILDVPAAIAARGFPPGVTAELHLDVADDLFEENRGRWLVRVADGRAAAERGGRGDVRIDVRGLAALYTSYAGAGDLATSGLAAGTPQALASAAAAFAGPLPWLADFF
jgi:predicted acetyltransferase